MVTRGWPSSENHVLEETEKASLEIKKMTETKEHMG